MLNLNKDMIEQRRMTRDEVNALIDDAPDSEVRNLLKAANNFDIPVYDFLNRFAIDHFGLLSNGRPLYMVILTNILPDHNELWTVVNSDVKEQYSLFKYSKRELDKWVEKYGDIYATMEKVSPRNIEWTIRMGFKVIDDDVTDNTISFIYKGKRKKSPDDNRNLITQGV